MKSDPDTPPLSGLGGGSGAAQPHVDHFRALLEMVVSPFGMALLILLLVATALVILVWGWESVSTLVQ